MLKYNLLFALVHAFVLTVHSLECYTCEKQDNNREKCVKTTKQCEQYYDYCLTNIRWRVPPYWLPSGQRITQIDKDCATFEMCEKRKGAVWARCKRDWYRDWECVECCTGDLCNYYATMGSSSIVPSIVTITVTGLLSLCYFVWYHRL